MQVIILNHYLLNENWQSKLVKKTVKIFLLNYWATK